MGFSWKLFRSPKQTLITPSRTLGAGSHRSPEKKGELEGMLQLLGARAWSSSRSQTLGVSGFLFSPAVLLPRDSESINRALKSLYDHARHWNPGLDVPFRVPPLKLQQNIRAAGEFKVDTGGWVTIQVSSSFIDNPKAVWLILAHEVCHHILNQCALSDQRNVVRNERLTDTAMFICGFGDLVQSGYQVIHKRGDGYTKTHLGYFEPDEYDYAYRWVISARKRNELPGMQGTMAADYTKALDFVVITSLEVLERTFRQRIPDQGTRERLIKYHRSKYPQLSREDLINLSLEGYSRDNR